MQRGEAGLARRRSRQHLGAEAGAAHAEQHGVAEAVLADPALERCEVCAVGGFARGDVEPAQPLVFVGAGPQATCRSPRAGANRRCGAPLDFGRRPPLRRRPGGDRRVEQLAAQDLRRACRRPRRTACRRRRRTAGRRRRPAASVTRSSEMPEPLSVASTASASSTSCSMRGLRTARGRGTRPWSPAAWC